MASTYTGPWINWSRGRILGPTITLDQQDGGLLTAFLALFVSTAGAATWKITCYGLHQMRAGPGPSDGLHHQQQAILCNSATPVGASWQLTQLTWYWKDRVAKPYTRTLPLIALAVINLTLFAVASVFSSEVTQGAGHETLVRSGNCGFLLYGEDDKVEMIVPDTLAATSYSRACYGAAREPLLCNQYAQRRLGWTTNPNATCPFAPELCMYGDAPTGYEMDTGLLNSQEDLGINAPDSDRVQYRKVTTCSPIHTRGYYEEYNETDVSRQQYGDKFSHAAAGLSAWTPIPELNRTDSDISLFILAPNSIRYEAPVKDPFFSANLPFDLGEGETLYVADHYLDVMACTEQHQYCNPVTSECTPLTAFHRLGHYLPGLRLNFPQRYTYQRLKLISLQNAIYQSVLSRGAQALHASETLVGTLNKGLPDNQWHIEVSEWFSVSMAKLQQLVVQYATGPDEMPDGAILLPPSNQWEQNMCENQIIRSQEGTLSFSILGVAIILVVGSILIFTSLVIDTVVGFLRRRLRRKSYKSLQWTLDEKLQLQRMAFEGAGHGHWKGGADVVPVTTKWGEQLGGGLEQMDPKHPRVGMRDLAYGAAQETGAVDPDPESEGLTGKKGMRVSAQHVIND
ncbi:MAG: hypothetical protein Q9172_002741 [Xanthocarpia lactea]